MAGLPLFLQHTYTLHHQAKHTGTPAMPAQTRSRTACLAPTIPISGAIEAVFFDPSLLVTILSSLDLPALAAVAAACRPLRDIIASPTHWEHRLRCHFPASAPLMDTIRARCGSARAFCRLRAEALGFKPAWRPSTASEEVRLRRALADTFIELHIENKETGRVLGARLIPAVGEEAALRSFFADEWVPLTYTTDVRSHFRNDRIRMTATLLRLAPELQTVLLAETYDDDVMNHGYALIDGSLWDGGLYCTTSPLCFPDACRFEMWYWPHLSIRQQTPFGTNDRELAMRFSMVAMQFEKDKELKFKSNVQIWGFLEFLLAAKPLWEKE